MTTRIVIADDHHLVRAGIRSLLEKIDNVQVVGEAGDGRAALDLVRDLSPDIALLDINMPLLNGLEAVDHIGKEYPATRAIVLSMYSNEEYVLQALRSGAAGYLLKDSAMEELEMAVRVVQRGDRYLSPSISSCLVEYLQRTGRLEPNAEKLTQRQREILQLIAEGHSTQQIAQILNLSAKTVETHRSQMMDRLEIYDVAGLVRYAIRIKLIMPE